MKRCPWPTKPLDIAYHDEEWGVPLRDDRRLFELLILEGAQAGLSWSTILAKRDNYRRAFDGLDPQRIARYTSRDLKRLLADPGIVRNRLKISATIDNARAYLELCAQRGGRRPFADHFWQFIGGNPRNNTFRSMREIPARTPESDAMSKDLKQRGFRFVGSTICYAFMQAAGMVNDHLVDCFRHAEIQRANSRSSRVARASR